MEGRVITALRSHGKSVVEETLRENRHAPLKKAEIFESTLLMLPKHVCRSHTFIISYQAVLWKLFKHIVMS